MIVARTRNSEANSEIDLDLIVALRETPFPGDTISLRDNRIVTVIRRRFYELDPDSDDKIDVVLDVRVSN